MLHFAGEKDFPLPAPALWKSLADARFLVRCIPDVESVSRSEPLEAEFTVRPGFAFVRGTLDTSLRVVDAVTAHTVRFELRSRGIGSHCTTDAALDLVPTEPGTRVRWTADVRELGGLLKAVPRGLIQASAQKVIADLWQAIERQLFPAE
jgi:carbon monoxide dehydrogenase subunit G